MPRKRKKKDKPATDRPPGAGLDMEIVRTGLEAKRKGRVEAKGGFHGALQAAADAKSLREGVTEGSGNVFRDLGTPGADEHQEKARLATRIARLARDGTLDEARAIALGAAKGELGDILRGRFRDVPLGKLARLAGADPGGGPRRPRDLVEEMLAKGRRWNEILAVARGARGGRWYEECRDILREMGEMPPDEEVQRITREAYEKTRKYRRQT